jgi:hypothetical protein
MAKPPRDAFGSAISMIANASQAPRRAPCGRELMDRAVHHFGRTVSRANNALSRWRISISIAMR